MITTLVIIALILVTVVGVQLLKAAELRAANKGELIYEVSAEESRLQGKIGLVFLIVFFVCFVWQVVAWGDSLLPVSASEHGVGLDNLLEVTWWFILPVGIITHILLFWFAYKYTFSSDRKATFFAHSNKLELIWTVIPTIALTVLILYGLSNWNAIMKMVPEETDHVLIELTGQQFTWTARYAGEDNKLGRAHVDYIEGVNAIGVDTTDQNSKDDKLVKGEFHLPVGVPIQFAFRSLDIIHSAYMPHFRAQMNCVPGLKTQFNFTPTITTKEMREITNNEEFNYVLLCNKICGAAHYNMQMDIVVESREDYEKWLAEQKGVN